MLHVGQTLNRFKLIRDPSLHRLHHNPNLCKVSLVPKGAIVGELQMVGGGGGNGQGNGQGKRGKGMGGVVEWGGGEGGVRKDGR